jgi:transposase-like protein
MVRKATPNLDELLDRVRRATNGRGRKTELARMLGVTPQRLNDWLSGINVPGGEVTLQMRDWVIAWEDQQKKRAGSAQTQPALKTRNQKGTSHAKPKSGPWKKE